MIKMIATYTNLEASNCGSEFQVDRVDIYAFVGVLLCRGIYAKGRPVPEMWIVACL
jgi:hypothetical protein